MDASGEVVRADQSGAERKAVDLVVHAVCRLEGDRIEESDMQNEVVGWSGIKWNKVERASSFRITSRTVAEHRGVE